MGPRLKQIANPAWRTIAKQMTEGLHGVDEIVHRTSAPVSAFIGGVASTYSWARGAPR